MRVVKVRAILKEVIKQADSSNRPLYEVRDGADRVARKVDGRGRIVAPLGAPMIQMIFRTEGLH